MADCYVGEIRMFGAPWAPQGWQLCDGTLLSIAQYPELFQLIGTTYGGDGQVMFGVPDLRGRLPVSQGQGTGLPPFMLGQVGGTETVALTGQQLPAHGHPFNATTVQG